MGLLSRQSEPGGMIQHFGLSEWWLRALTKEQRHRLEKLYADASSLTRGVMEPARLASGTPPPTSERAPQLLGQLAVLADKGCPEIVPLLLAKEEELALASGNVIDLHLAYALAIKLSYARREKQDDAFDAAVRACEKQIAIAPQAWDAFASQAEASARRNYESTGENREVGFTPPSHRGYEQLAIIREEQGDLQEALRLSKEAQRQGWREMDHGDWSMRIAQVEKRIANG